MRIRTTLLSLSAITLIPLSSLAADIFVTQGGAGDGSGSSFDDAMSVDNHNAQSFAPGDRIFLCGDLSSTVEPQSSGTANEPLLYSGACDPDGDSSNGVEHPGHIDRGTLYGANIFGVAIRGQSHIVVEDLEISFCSDGVYATDASYITVRRCTIHDCAYRGVWFANNGAACTDVVVGGAPGDGNEIFDIAWGTAGGDVVTSAGIERLLISYNRLYGKTPGRGIDGIAVHETTDLTIEYNQIFDHDDDQNADPAGEDYHPRSGRGEDGIDLKNASNRVVIRFNDIWGHPYQSGITAQLGSHDVEIYGNRIRDNRTGIMMQAGNDENWGQRVHDVRIWSNLVYRSAGNGIRAITSSVSQQPVDDVTIINNLIAGNCLDEEYDVGEANNTGLSLVTGTGHLVANNLLFGNSGWISSNVRGPYKQVHVGNGQATQVSFDHNGYYWPEHQGEDIFYWGAAGDLGLAGVQSGDQAGLPQEANGWEADPGFVDAELYDYELREDGAARDAGDSSVGDEFGYGLGPGTDFDQVLEGASAILWVPRGEQWDCGAYEYVEQTEEVCEDMGGSCCGPDEECAGGQSQPWDACGGGCCIGGECVPTGEGGGGAGGAGGGDIGGGGTSPAPGEGAEDDSGCGCRVAAKSSEPGGAGISAWLLLLMGLGGRRRSGRRRRSAS